MGKSKSPGGGKQLFFSETHCGIFVKYWSEGFIDFSTPTDPIIPIVTRTA